jgi:hypothetical protein
VELRENSIVELFEDVKFIICSCEEVGGALRSRVDLFINKCFFDRCKAKGHTISRGGAIFCDGDCNSLNILFCLFAGCTSEGGIGGGAITFQGSGTLHIGSTTFLSCICDGGDGGALWINRANVILNNCSLFNCESVSGNGGGIAQVDGSSESEMVLQLINCIFIGNKGKDRGGAVDVRNISVICTNCFFAYNSVTFFGSGISIDLQYSSTSAIFNNCAFVRNIVKGCANRNGGAIYIAPVIEGKFTVIKNIFYENDFIDRGCGYSMLLFFLCLMCYIDTSDIRVNPTCVVSVSESYSINYNGTRKVELNFYYIYLSLVVFTV